MKPPTDAANHHKVLAEKQPKLVNLELTISKLDPTIVKPVVTDGIIPIAGRFKDRILDSITLPESVISDPNNGLAEGIGGQIPGGGVVNPAPQTQSQAHTLATTPVTNAVTIA